MGEPGQVVEASEKSVTIKLRRTEACGECKACLSSGKDMLITAKNACDAQLGDWVRVELNESSFLSATFIMYGFPFAFLIIGLLTGYFIAGLVMLDNLKELFGFVTGIIFMLLSYTLIKSKDWKSERYTPAAVEIITREYFLDKS